VGRLVYAKCMAVKTITIDMEAYERLSSLKRSGQSFSQVIKEHLPASGTTARDLLARLDEAAISDETLTAIEQVIAERGRHPVRVPEW
jgi:predicted CopG family antitoxin